MGFGILVKVDNLTLTNFKAYIFDLNRDYKLVDDN